MTTTEPVITAQATTGAHRRVARRVENTEYAQFVARAIRAHGRRVAEGDASALVELSELSGQLDAAMAVGVTGLRAAGWSWGDIGTHLGISRQGAQQRWGK